MLTAMIFAGMAGLSVGLLFADSAVLYGLYALGLVAGLSVSLGLVVSSWYGLGLLLVYLGGLMVMFSYFLALCPNQRGWGKKWVGLGLAGVSVGGFAGEWWGGLAGAPMMELTELFKGLNFSLLVVLAFMLLLVMVVVVKVVGVSQGPLRPFSG